jgi:sporulation protein YlmC with PRC-barrel domain
VTVQQQAPTVSVTQGQPEITVHQPAPVVTIDIPKPEITVRMPKPSVEVAQAAPKVVVNQPKPEVHVIPPAKPDVNTTTAQTNVAVSQAAPIIHYESEQPQVHVTQAQGEPTIKVEQFDRTIDRAAPTTASLPGTGPQVTASELTGKTVMGPQGQKLGTVKAVILDAQNRPFIVVERSGIGSTIGILAKQIPIPAQNAKLDGGQVMIQGLTMAQINGIREYKSEPTYRTVQGDQTISMIRS